MCYVGKATKIFFFIVTLLVATGLTMGFVYLWRQAKSPQCPYPSSSGDAPIVVLPGPTSDPTPPSTFAPHSATNPSPAPPPPGPTVPDSSPPVASFSPPPPFNPPSPGTEALGPASSS
ncbi:prolinerich family protein [Striga asiatica]|uniref:Prolinerich family protein n=1 Tax=Striga asiatica TaxID=4170 RepID=A0A5A7R7H5_STRAF|nr:prolinerich family protein [Striga asiatica]